MTYRLIFYVFFCLSFVTTILKAQTVSTDFIFEHLNKSSYAIDDECSAIVLYEKAVTTINNGSSMPETFHLYKVVKILHSKDNAIANFTKIATPPLKIGGFNKEGEGVKNIKAVTYNLVDEKMVTTVLAKDAIYKKKLNNKLYETVFALPDIKDGSIIEYSYDLELEWYPTLPSWSFQESIPKLRSEYEIDIPIYLKYTAIKQGTTEYKSYKNETEAIKDSAKNYEISSLSSEASGVSNQRLYKKWVMSDISAIKEEPYVSSIENYRQKLELQFAGSGMAIYDKDQNFLSNWEQLDQFLWNHKKFGKKLTSSNKFLQPFLDSLLTDSMNDGMKAKKIFQFVRENFTCIDYAEFWTDRNLEDTYTHRAGTVADINLLLTAMCIKAGLNASPVLLNKLGGPMASEKYPIISRFDYLVCAIKIDTTYYFCDATDKYNCFGLLPRYCYNGYARIVNKKGKGVYLNTSDITDKRTYSLNIADSSTVQHIDMAIQFDKVGARKYRKRWVEDTTRIEKYIKDELTGVQADMISIDLKWINLNNPDTSLIIYCTIVCKRNEHNSKYLSTDLIKFFKQNSFTTTKRRLPIEFDCKKDYKYILNYRMAPTAQVENIPEPVAIYYDNKEIEFKHMVSYDSSINVMSVSAQYKVNHVLFPSHDYNTLKYFMEQIMRSQSDVVVIK